MQVRIHNLSHDPCAVRIPASKSLSHRALIAASLANGVSHLSDLAENRDTEATAAAIQLLGATIIKESSGSYEIHGINDLSAYEGSVIDCGESGSTLRFLIPLFSLTGKKAVFTGHGKLMERPMQVYEQLFHDQGLYFEQKDGLLTVEGALKPGTYSIRGDVSSQFISGLLMAMPLADGTTTLQILPPYESKSYVGLTEDVLEQAGIQIEDHGNEIIIRGNQHYQPLNMRIDGDDSQAVFFLSLACTGNKTIEVQGMRHDSRQGDHAVIELLKHMGEQIEETDTGYRAVPDHLQSAIMNLEDCPDLGPMLFALASQAEGETVFVHAERLRMKESDRIACMEEELRKLGCTITSEGGTVKVQGPTRVKGNVTVDGHNDHRIVMALSILAAAAEEPVTITGAEAINKSYPGFFEDLKTLNVEVEQL